MAPSTVPCGDTSTALEVGGRTRGLARKHLLAFAAGIGLPAKAATAALDELISRLADLPDEIASGVLPFCQKTNADLAAELRYRLRQAV